MRRGDVTMIFGCLRYLYRNCKSIAQQNVTPAAVSFDLAKKQLALVINILKTLHINILHLYIREKQPFKTNNVQQQLHWGKPAHETLIGKSLVVVWWV